MAEESGSLSSLGKLIPSVYYDLIARICPGVGFLLALLWHKIHIFDHVVSNEWIGFFILLGAGYIAGLILTALSSVWFFSIGWLVRRRLHVPLDDWYGNDKMSKDNPEFGTTLAKMQAEETLAHNILTGFLILWVVNRKRALYLGAIMRHPRIVLVILLATAIHRTCAYVLRHKDLYKLYLSLPAFRPPVGPV